MKVKKIDFQPLYPGATKFFHCKLSTGQTASIEQIATGAWPWEITAGARDGDYGVAETKELAVEACNKAWTQMIMDAIEQ